MFARFFTKFCEYQTDKRSHQETGKTPVQKLNMNIQSFVLLGFNEAYMFKSTSKHIFLDKNRRIYTQTERLDAEIIKKGMKQIRTKVMAEEVRAG